jgi:hypothetical protein
VTIVPDHGVLKRAIGLGQLRDTPEPEPAIRPKYFVLSKSTPINAKAGRYQPDDDLLAFLKGL